ncbi:MAG: hypothetical protein H6815_13995 [Phycisphaeraceae bacterium]|nr:hypothetical protein [Phycisphaerales bacterium]MCB9861551.1 hypothetical protein [Phycisphaeraceae bacterium]
MSLWILAVIVGLLVAGIRAANNRVSQSADRHAVRSLKIAIEQFKQDHGFLPPLVDDTMPPLNGTALNVYQLSDPMDLQFLRTKQVLPTVDPRFSIYSLGLYLFGPLDATIDGKDGPGFRKPNADGTFQLSGGRVFDPVVDGSRGMQGLVPAEPQGEGRFEIHDRHDVPFRYYRWERGKPNNGSVVLLPDDLNVPEIVGDASTQVELRSADYAVVGAGPNGVFGDEDPFTLVGAVGGSVSDVNRLRERARSDNIVEIGTK